LVYRSFCVPRETAKRPGGLGPQLGSPPQGGPIIFGAPLLTFLKKSHNSLEFNLLCAIFDFAVHTSLTLFWVFCVTSRAGVPLPEIANAKATIHPTGGNQMCIEGSWG
jgi:hypothetical protein